MHSLMLVCSCCLDLLGQTSVSNRTRTVRCFPLSAEIVFLQAPSSFSDYSRFTRPRSFTGGPSSLCCRVFAVQCLQLGREVLHTRSVYVIEFSRCRVCNLVARSFTGGPSSLCCRVFAVQRLQLDRIQGTRASAIYEGHAGRQNSTSPLQKFLEKVYSIAAGSDVQVSRIAEVLQCVFPFGNGAPVQCFPGFIAKWAVQLFNLVPL